MDHWLTLENRLKSDNWCDEQAYRDNWNKEKNIYNYYISREKKQANTSYIVQSSAPKECCGNWNSRALWYSLLKFGKWVIAKDIKKYTGFEINFLINKEPTGN